MEAISLRRFELTVSSGGALSIKGSTRALGRMGEVGATQLVVDVGGWAQAFDGAVYSVLVRLPDQTTWPLLAGTVPDDGKLTAVIPSEVFATPGNVSFEVRAERNGRLMKTSTAVAAVNAALAKGPAPASVGQARPAHPFGCAAGR